MRVTKRKPSSVGSILKEEFLEPLNITNGALADAMHVHRNTVSAIINGKDIHAAQAVRLAGALGTSPEFWLNLQHSVDLWNAANEFKNIDITSLVSVELAATALS